MTKTRLVSVRYAASQYYGWLRRTVGLTWYQQSKRSWATLKNASKVARWNPVNVRSRSSHFCTPCLSTGPSVRLISLLPSDLSVKFHK